jgi:uncharacterized protein HemX
LARKRRRKKLSSLDKAKALATSKTKLPAGGSMAIFAVAAVSVVAAVGVGLYAWDRSKKSRRRFNYV